MRTKIKIVLAGLSVLMVSATASGAGCYETHFIGNACDGLLGSLYPEPCLVIDTLNDPIRSALSVYQGGRGGKVNYDATCQGVYYTTDVDGNCTVSHPLGPQIYGASFATGLLCPPFPGG